MNGTLCFHQNNASPGKPFCSVLIPTRARPKGVLGAIRSIRDTSVVEDVDIWLRLDSDDNLSLNAMPELLNEAHIVVGQRLGGYYSLNVFYTELADHSNAPFVWLFNDDCTISGEWLNMLKFFANESKAQRINAKYEPATFQVGKSIYHNHTPTTCPIIPNGCWKRYGLETVPAVTDVHLHELLSNHGWQTKFLPTLHLTHERYPDEVYREHRKLR